MFPTVELGAVQGLYSADNKERYEELLKGFEQRYGKKAQFVARAPGRVNIIGEHIDYEGYGVLPAAIEKDCLIAVAVNQSQDIAVSHVHPHTYPSQLFKVDPTAKMEFVNNYHKYFRAGYRAGVRGLPLEQLKGLEVMISGNVPIAAGLSSSSALCVCAALAALYANGGIQGDYQEGSREQFIEAVIAGERETGTASGGMDQSISVMGRQDNCLYIQFGPIRCEKVHLPPGCKFVIMNSLVLSAKLETAVFRYNKRVCECRLAVRLAAKRLKMPGSPKVLQQLEQWSGLSLDMLGRLVDSFIDRHDYTQQELEGLLGEHLSDILADIPLHDEVIKANKHFRLW
jgi:N-acetylgalactosamine kinase